MKCDKNIFGFTFLHTLTAVLLIGVLFSVIHSGYDKLQQTIKWQGAVIQARNDANAIYFKEMASNAPYSVYSTHSEVIDIDGRIHRIPNDIFPIPKSRFYKCLLYEQC